MKITLVYDVENFIALKEEWNQLLTESTDDVIYLSHEWFAACWKSLNSEARLHILVVHDDDGSLAAICPFMKSRASYYHLPVTKLSFIITDHSPSVNIIVQAGKTKQVIEAILHYIAEDKGWDVFELRKINFDSLFYNLFIETMTESKHLFLSRTVMKCPVISLDEAWEVFLKKKSSRFRKSLRNKNNRIMKAGTVEIERTRITSDTSPALKQVYRISEKSWKRSERRDLLSNPSYLIFYDELSKLLEPGGNITLWFLNFNGTPVAFEYHLEYKGIVYPIRADFDETYKHLSPGSILEYNILKTLSEEGRVKQYNTCGTTYKYLMNWTDELITYMTIEVFRSNATSYGLYILKKKLIPMIKQLGLRRK
jgi:CelD/BcsL family acetyltransferase involved in cellulose biosynthesis